MVSGGLRLQHQLWLYLFFTQKLLPHLPMTGEASHQTCSTSIYLGTSINWLELFFCHSWHFGDCKIIIYWDRGLETAYLLGLFLQTQMARSHLLGISYKCQVKNLIKFAKFIIILGYQINTLVLFFCHNLHTIIITSVSWLQTLASTVLYQFSIIF